MGVICLALIANGNLQGGEGFDVPRWVVISCATAIALGTYTGGWRIIKTLGTKVVEVRPSQGFGSEAVAATVILVSSNAGYPLSTTQVVSGAVTGSGVGHPGAAVNWGVAGRIVVGWILTLPAAAAAGGIVYAVIKLFGADSAVGPIVTGLALVVGASSSGRPTAARRSSPRRRSPSTPCSAQGRTPARGPTPVGGVGHARLCLAGLLAAVVYGIQLIAQ
jgi:PiT family inorganic phosphate transporter